MGRRIACIISVGFDDNAANAIDQQDSTNQLARDRDWMPGEEGGRDRSKPSPVGIIRFQPDPAPISL